MNPFNFEGRVKSSSRCILLKVFLRPSFFLFRQGWGREARLTDVYCRSDTLRSEELGQLRRNVASTSLICLCVDGTLTAVDGRASERTEESEHVVNNYVTSLFMT